MPDGSGRLTRTPFQGIYKFEPDGRLLICYRPKTDDGRILRPTRFATAHNSGAILLSLRRPEPVAVTHYVPPVTSYQAAREPISNPMVPPPPVSIVPPATAPAEPLYVGGIGPVAGTISPDIELLQGAWMLVVEDGKPANDKALALEIIKDRVLASDGTHGRFQIDESRSPKQISITIGKQPGDTTKGIYKLEGDRLTIASYNGPGKLLPTAFEPDPDTRISVMVLERQKAPPSPPKVEPARSLPRAEAQPRIEPAIPPIPEREQFKNPSRAPERDLIREIDQLKEQLKRLEKELKDRK
jgi:uncharacterized protein (TIGR03067 family)